MKIFLLLIAIITISGCTAKTTWIKESSASNPARFSTGNMNPTFDINRVKELARQMIAGDIGILAGSRKMVLLYHEGDLDDDAFGVFIALDSETDDCLLEPIGFPISEGRREANSRKIKYYEDCWRTDVLKQCRTFIDDIR